MVDVTQLWAVRSHALGLLFFLVAFLTGPGEALISYGVAIKGILRVIKESPEKYHHGYQENNGSSWYGPPYQPCIRNIQKKCSVLLSTLYFFLVIVPQ
jgi:hypothetical protein